MAFLSASVAIGDSTKKSSFDQLLANDAYLKAENVNEKKTFLSSTVFNATATFNSGTVFEIKPKMDGILTRSSTGSVSLECQYVSSAGNSVVILKTKVIEIGDWNMDTTPSVTIISGIDKEKVRAVSGIIIDDNSVNVYRLNKGSSGGINGLMQGSVDRITDNNIELRRLNGGEFDGVSYNSTSFNRGWITILYED